MYTIHFHSSIGARSLRWKFAVAQQSQLFHTISEHDAPNDVALPPQVRLQLHTRAREHAHMSMPCDLFG